MRRRNATHEFFSPTSREFQALLANFLNTSYDNSLDAVFEPLSANMHQSFGDFANFTNLTLSIFDDISRASSFQPQYNLYEKRYQDREYNSAKTYFVQNIKKNKSCDYVSITLLNVLLDFKRENNETFPSSEQLVEKIFNIRCRCVFFHSETDIKRLILDYISEKADIPNCQEYSTLLEFYILHKRLPTDEELEEYARRTMEFFTNPEDFHQKDKIRVPTLNIDKLPVIQYNGESCSTCSLCQEDFSEKQNVIILQPCNHHFHHDKKDCLETASIITWLEKNNFCPLCKTKVEVKI